VSISCPHTILCSADFVNTALMWCAELLLYKMSFTESHSNGSVLFYLATWRFYCNCVIFVPPIVSVQFYSYCINVSNATCDFNYMCYIIYLISVVFALCTDIIHLVSYVHYSGISLPIPTCVSRTYHHFPYVPCAFSYILFSIYPMVSHSQWRP